jgi:hypothetical protein
MRLVREPDAGDLHVRFDERDVETGLWRGYVGTVRRKRRQQTSQTYCYRATSRYRELPVIQLELTTRCGPWQNWQSDAQRRSSVAHVGERSPAPTCRLQMMVASLSTFTS